MTNANQPKLTKEEQINALRSVHNFLSNFDRVPGFLSAQWGQALEALGVVTNNIITEHVETVKQAAEKTQTENKVPEESQVPETKPTKSGGKKTK